MKKSDLDDIANGKKKVHTDHDHKAVEVPESISQAETESRKQEKEKAVGR